MTNKQFKIELRMALRKAKEQFLKDNTFQLTCRYDNLERAHLKSLQDFVIKYFYMTDREVKQMLRQNPNTLSFLNYCIEVEPCLATRLRNENVVVVYDDIHSRRKVARLKPDTEIIR